MIAVRTLHRLDELAPAALGLLAGDVFSTPAWFRAVLAYAMPPDAAPLFLLAEQAGHPLGLLALKRRGRAIESLTTPYSCAFAPCFAVGLSDAQRRDVGGALARACRAWPVTRLDALDLADPRVEALVAGARAAGLAVCRFDHFGNWHEAVAGLSWADYLAGRPGSLRSTIGRKTAAATRAGASLMVIRDGAGLDAGIAAYEDIYARSWKQPEPFPRFNAGLMRALAPLGQLRLGLMQVGGEPVAAQIWLVAEGIATVVKLAHDAAFQATSPGTVLTAHMIRHLLEEGYVREIDFGRGDDPYKRDWASARRQRSGLLLVNPRHPAGLAVLARQGVGALRRLLYRRSTLVTAG